MKYDFDYKKHKKEITGILQEIQKIDNIKWKNFRQILAKYPKDGNKMFSKNNLVIGYKALLEENKNGENNNIPGEEYYDEIISKIQMKPVRTQSGVTTVTILTKPFPCPGKCIFCPNDVRMPKSYLADEPGAQRAARNKFDPYLQTYRRLEALRDIGHNTEKIEMIILGGTWSYYPEHYQIWFIKRCFEALNDFGDKINKTEQVESETENFKFDKEDLDQDKAREETYNKMIGKIAKKSGITLSNKEQSATWQELFEQHKRNETNNTRCVGLVIETRPDNISEEEVIRIRKLGCTKAQIGFQSLNDEVLEKNKRGHDVEATKRAVKLLRTAGFKIHAHWMANLYGSDVEKDIADYKKMFEDPAFKPDELKIYPCILIQSAELMDYYNKGLWKPYNREELLQLLTNVITNTPEYCRLTRIIREFSSSEIVDGNKETNFRQIAEAKLDKLGIERKDIRSREIKNQDIKMENLELKITEYETEVGKEFFLQYITNNKNKKIKSNQIAGFLRLSLPKNESYNYIQEIYNHAIIREIHIYGRAINIGDKKKGKAQHLGLGKKLIENALRICKEYRYIKLSVISSIGTREYYRKQGFKDGDLYQSLNII